MAKKTRQIVRATSIALLCGGIATTGGIDAAFAQDIGTQQAAKSKKQAESQPETQKAVTLGPIQVTGSHIQRSELETSNPMITIGAQEIEDTGELTLGDVLAQLPVVTGGVMRPTVNNGGGTGATQVGVRGLGPARTLLLVNGHRVIFGGLNQVPVDAVARIEVLTDGASAVYGSDAIAGVINIILKDRFKGAKVKLNYGISDRGDGARRGATFTFGQSTRKGSVYAGIDYNKFDSILQDDRDFSRTSLSLTTTPDGVAHVAPLGAVGEGGSFDLPAGTAAAFGCDSQRRIALNESARTSGTSPTGPSDYHCFDAATDRWGNNRGNYLVTPRERIDGYFHGVYHLTKNTDVYATWLHSKTNANRGLLPATLVSNQVAGVTVSKDSYYNPFGADFKTPGGSAYRMRLYPLGQRTLHNSRTMDQLLFGVRGETHIWDKTWRWDVGMGYGHVSTVNTRIGYPISTQLVEGLATPSMMDPATGQVVCVSTPNDLGTVIPGCTPWDPFNLESASAQSVLQDANDQSSAMVNTWDIQRIWHAGANGEIANLPAGAVSLAVGVDYHEEYTNNAVSPVIQIDPETSTCDLGAACSQHMQGGYNVKEAYAEVYVPILKGLPLVHDLSVTLGDRYSKYSTFGSTNNWKVGLEYRPVSTLLLRGTVSTVFRAPTINDIFRAPQRAATLLTSDPCNHITVANPACSGVPLDGSFVNTIVNQNGINGLWSGAKAANFALGPEHGSSFDFGFVYSPGFVSGLSLSMDIWRIYLKDAIGRANAQTVLDLCFNGVTEFCPLVTREQSGPNAGQVTRVIQPIANLGRVDTKGTDLSVHYRLPKFAIGQFNVKLNATYQDQFKVQTSPGSPGGQVLEGAGMMGVKGSSFQAACLYSPGAVCLFPRIRAVGNLRWNWRNWGAGWRIRYMSPFKVAGSTLDRQGIDRYGAWVYNSVNVDYNIRPINTRLSVGIRNVFDKQPPMLFANRSSNANTDPGNFNVIGRYYWMRVAVSF